MSATETTSGRLPAVDIVVLTWNDGAHAERALAAATQSRGVELRLWVVDNGSDPPFSTRVPVAGLLRQERNRGVARGRNDGAAMGEASYLGFLDSDAVVASDTFRLLVHALSHDGVAMAVPRFEDQAPEATAGARPGIGRKLARSLGLTARYGKSGEGTDVRTVEFAIGACQLMRRSVFEEVGGLDDTYFYGPEDIDFCDRLRAAGWKIVQVDAARVHHSARRTHRKPFTRRGLRHAVALVRFYSRRRPRPL